MISFFKRTQIKYSVLKVNDKVDDEDDYNDNDKDNDDDDCYYYFGDVKIILLVNKCKDLSEI